MTASAKDIIDALGLSPHPEGGWYRETWRAPPGADGRSLGTAIHFLLERGQRSHWHRVDAAELWLHQGGGALRLDIARPDGVETLELSSRVEAGATNQAVVPPGTWQAAGTDDDWALVACVVVPGFEFAGFEMAPPGWRPGAG